MPKHVGPNLVFADDDQQRSRPGRLAKHPAFSLLYSPAGYLTPPVDFVTDERTDGRTDRRIKGVLGLLYHIDILENQKTKFGINILNYDYIVNLSLKNNSHVAYERTSHRPTIWNVAAYVIRTTCRMQNSFII